MTIDITHHVEAKATVKGDEHEYKLFLIDTGVLGSSYLRIARTHAATTDANCRINLEYARDVAETMIEMLDAMEEE